MRRVFGRTEFGCNATQANHKLPNCTHGILMHYFFYLWTNVWDKTRSSSCFRRTSWFPTIALCGVGLNGTLRTPCQCASNKMTIYFGWLFWLFHIHEATVIQYIIIIIIIANARIIIFVDLCKSPMTPHHLLKNSGGVSPSIIWCVNSFLSIEHFDNGRLRARAPQMFHFYCHFLHWHSERCTRNKLLWILLFKFMQRIFAFAVWIAI